MTTPLIRQEWAKALANHPDKAFRDYALNGIEEGFHIGYNHQKHNCRQPMCNMKSAEEREDIIQEYLDRDVSQRHVLSPVDPKDAKVGNTRKGRLIVDLSSPKGKSVNDGIEPELCSLQYLRLDEAVQQVVRVGHGAMLAKMDVESAHRIILVHPDDRPLLGMWWKGALYYDKCLPLGLRLTPKIFRAVADALQWVFQQRGVTWIRKALPR